MTTRPLVTVQLLDELLARWQERDLPVVAARRPGLSEQNIDALECELGTVFSDELRCWWSWQDGAPRPALTTAGRNRTIGTHPGPELLTAQHAVAQARLMQQADEGNYPLTDPDRLRSWDPRWLPVTRNISGGVLACETGGPRSEACRVRYVHFGVTEIPPPVTAESLGQIVAWWIELYDRGLYRYSEEHDIWLCDDSDLEHFPGPDRYRSFYASS